MCWRGIRPVALDQKSVGVYKECAEDKDVVSVEMARSSLRIKESRL